MANERDVQKEAANLVQYAHPSAIQGWTELGKDEQLTVVRETEAIAESRMQQGMAMLNEGRHLINVQKILEPRRMFQAYLKQYYATSIKTAYRYIEWFKVFEKQYAPEVLRAILYRSAELPGGKLSPHQFLAATKELPAPKTAEPKVIDHYLTQARENHRKILSRRRKGASSITEEMALKECFNFVLNAMGKCQFKNTADKGDWLERLAGMLAQAQAVPGKRTLARVAVPEGFRKRRGRPRKLVPARS